MFCFLRPIALCLTVLALVACEPVSIAPEGQSAGLVVGQIDIDMSAFGGVRGREFSRTPAQVEADLRGALKQVLARPGTANTTLSVKIGRIDLVSPGQALLIGGSSAMSAQIVLIDNASRTNITPPKDVIFLSERTRLGGLIGAATSPSATNDYQQTINGFARRTYQAIYGSLPPS